MWPQCVVLVMHWWMLPCSQHLSVGVSAGFPWPKTDKPVALVECDHGTEMRAGAMRGGKISVTQSVAPGASSYCNAEEAGLAIRSAARRTSSVALPNRHHLFPSNSQRA